MLLIKQLAVFCTRNHLIWPCFMIPAGSSLLCRCYMRPQQTFYFLAVIVASWQLRHGAGILKPQFCTEVELPAQLLSTFVQGLFHYIFLVIILRSPCFVLLINNRPQFVLCTLQASGPGQTHTHAKEFTPSATVLMSHLAVSRVLYHQHNSSSQSTNTIFQLLLPATDSVPGAGKLIL